MTVFKANFQAQFRQSGCGAKVQVMQENKEQAWDWKIDVVDYEGVQEEHSQLEMEVSIK